MDPVLEIADRYGLSIIEDAAEAHGQLYKGRPCGSFGDISTFSFYPNKHITPGKVAWWSPIMMISLRNVARFEICVSSVKRRFVHEELGWNLRMTNLQAALGVAQLEAVRYLYREEESDGGFL